MGTSGGLLDKQVQLSSSPQELGLILLKLNF